MANAKMETVQKMQDYIAENIDKEITLADLAEKVHFSPWYCARLFKEWTALSPGDYIRKLKLSKSALRLRDEGAKILDIAYDMGFNSVDGYQRAFSREFGCNPKEYEMDPKPIALFTPYGVKFKDNWKEERMIMETVKNVFVQVITKPERKVIIKRAEKASGYWDYCTEVGCDVWGLLMSIKSISGEPVCLWLPDHYRDGKSKYVMGVEVDANYNGEVPEGYDVIVLPECKYLMFQGEPFREEDYCVAIKNVEDSMDKYDPSIIGYRWDDTNPRVQLEPIGTRGYIEMKAVKGL